MADEDEERSLWSFPSFEGMFVSGARPFLANEMGLECRVK